MSESVNTGQPGAGTTSPPGMPEAVDRATFQASLDRLRAREKAHTREGDAIAAARRRLPMVEMDPAIPPDRPGRPGNPAGSVRGPDMRQPGRLLLHVARF